jgi:fructokinase
MTEILVAGETLVDLFPTDVGKLSEIEGFKHHPGGAPANVAVGLSRLGHPPRFWTRLATDPFGEFLAGVLEREAIPTSHIRQVEEGNTTLAVVSPRSDGEQEFSFYRSGDATFGFTDEEITEEMLHGCSWFHFGGVTLTHPSGERAMFELASMARSNGCTVSFDLNLREELISDHATDTSIDNALELTDVVFCSPEDIESIDIDAEDDKPLAETLVGRGPHTAIVTLGDAGVVVASSADAPWGAQSRRYPVFRTSVVDTTGAGDAFAAATIAQLVDHWSDIDNVIAFASAAAALSISETGGMSSLPSRLEVDEFLQRRGEELFE